MYIELYVKELLPVSKGRQCKEIKLEEILVIAILAIICCYAQFTEMELFGHEQKEWLRTFLKLEFPHIRLAMCLLPLILKRLVKENHPQILDDICLVFKEE